MQKEQKPTTKDVKQAFSDRLNWLLDSYGAPEKYAGRQVFVKKAMKVSQETARKWLEGVSIPRKPMIHKICQKWPCRASWLEYGELPSKNDSQTVELLGYWESMKEDERGGLLLLFRSRKP